MLKLKCNIITFSKDMAFCKMSTSILIFECIYINFSNIKNVYG